MAADPVAALSQVRGLPGRQLVCSSCSPSLPRLVGTTTVLTNVAAVLVLCGYYGYLVATGSVTLDQHCQGLFWSKTAYSH